MRPRPNVVQKCGNALSEDSPAFTFAAALLTSSVGKPPWHSPVTTVAEPPTGMKAPPLLTAPAVFATPPVFVTPPVLVAPLVLFVAPPLPPLLLLPPVVVLGPPALSALVEPASQPFIASATGIVRRPIVAGWRKERSVDRPFIDCVLS